MASLAQTIRGYWSLITGRQPARDAVPPQVILHDPGAQRPHDLDDPFFDPKVQSRMGGVIAGFGDQREVELLVEAGFTPLEAIHIATANGAQFLGELDSVGTIAAGKQADLLITEYANAADNKHQQQK